MRANDLRWELSQAQVTVGHKVKKNGQHMGHEEEGGDGADNVVAKGRHVDVLIAFVQRAVEIDLELKVIASSRIK